MSAVKDKKGFKCHLCPKSYVTERGYRNHLSVHPVASTTTADSQNVAITSTASGSTRSTSDKNSSLGENKTAGNDVDVFTCGVCDKTFKTNNGLTKHLKTHNQDLTHPHDLASEAISNQIDDGMPLNSCQDWLEDDPDDPNDKQTEIDEVSYFEELIEEEEEEDARRVASLLDEPPPKKQKTGKARKAKKPPLVKCSTCKRPFQTLEGFMKPRQTHVIEVQ